MNWKMNWIPTPVFLPGEFYGQRSLAGYSPWGRKESDMTKWLTHTHMYEYMYIYICIRMCMWRRHWQPTSVFSARRSHGESLSLVGYRCRVRHDSAKSTHMCIYHLSLIHFITIDISLPSTLKFLEVAIWSIWEYLTQIVVTENKWKSWK